MAQLLELSARFIDTGAYEGPTSVNRVTMQLSEVADGVGFVEAFSNVVVIDSDEGLVLFDTSLEMFAPMIHGAVRGWSDKRVASICYTHGHVDHIGGAQRFFADAAERGDPEPQVIGHEAVARRFERYALTNSYNALINARQFSQLGGGLLGNKAGDRWGPETWIAPSVTFADALALRVGDVDIELHHALGETDDHAWAWLPKQRAVAVGDFVAWVFPNAGNPQKVQRYPRQWAQALRDMIAKEPELMLPAHGLPVGGKERVATVLNDIATTLESLVAQTLERMNAGATLDSCIHEVKPPADLMERPYLRPVYDEPEFVIRNIWRLYGGWYDGNPAHLKPPAAAHLGAEIAALSGGVQKLTARAVELCEAGDLRLACELIELAASAAPDDSEVHATRAAIYQTRRHSETSLMAKGIYGSTASESRAKADA